jgi:hypothetical protein
MKRLWSDTFVEEANLANHVSMVRKALGETAQDRRYILTLPGIWSNRKTGRELLTAPRLETLRYL